MARCPIDHQTCHRETEEQCPHLDGEGKAICTLGKTEIPMLASNAFTSYEIKYHEGGITEVRLSQTHVAYLLFLSQRGGETEFDYKKVTPEVAEHLRKMVEMGILVESPIVGREAVLQRLTDVGRNLVTKIRKG